MIAKSAFLNVVLYLAALNHSLLAQEDLGRITGTLRDPNNNPLTGFAGATVWREGLARSLS